jgi:hypothetical protein
MLVLDSLPRLQQTRARKEIPKVNELARHDGEVNGSE